MSDGHGAARQEAGGPDRDPDAKCERCDGVYCGPTCKGQDGYIWVAGYGWADPFIIRVSLKTNLDPTLARRVRWDDVFTNERFPA